MLRSPSLRAVVVIGIVAASPIVYWLASPLVLNVMVSEQLPSQGSSQGAPILSTSFQDADSFHRTSGNASILKLSDGSLVLRLSDFKTTNGPDLFVYLATDRGAHTTVNLGQLKGNIGDQNYAIPAGTDFAKYGYVLIWCRTFGVLFGSGALH